MQSLIQRRFFTFAITKFKPTITQNVVSNTSPNNLNPPQVISTADREKYRHENKIKFKRNPKDLDENWTRDFHNRVYTEKEAMTEASRCMKCADSPCQKACLHRHWYQVLHLPNPEPKLLRRSQDYPIRQSSRPILRWTMPSQLALRIHVQRLLAWRRYNLNW